MWACRYVHEQADLSCTQRMILRARTLSLSFSLVLTVALLVPFSVGGDDGNSSTTRTIDGRFDTHSPDAARDVNAGPIGDLRGSEVARVLHPNPQSILDGLQLGFVNVSSGNLTFERRDIVVPGRQPVTFSRIYDSRIRDNADFGPGWRLSLDEEIVVDDQGASYVDGAGASYRFRRKQDGQFILDPVVPRHSDTRLAFSGESATLFLGDGGTRVFERLGTERRWLLTRIDAPNGDWIAISHRDGRLEAVFDTDGELLSVVRDIDGRMSSVVDRHGREVRYDYDGSRLAQVRDVAGNPWSHDYDTSNRLVSALNANADAYLRVGYDATGRVVWSVAEDEYAFDYGPDSTVAQNRTTGERQVFERTPTGIVVGFSSTTGIAWGLSLDSNGRVETLGISEAAARLVDDGPDAFRPDGMAAGDGEQAGVWPRVIRFIHSANGVAATETVSAAGVERRD